MNTPRFQVAPPVELASLDHLDSLIGRYIMHDTPSVYWEHAFSQWRFDSLGEALDALDDPYFCSLVPEGHRSIHSVAEVREFPAYSSDLGHAMKVVERLGTERQALTLSPQSRLWAACFGEHTKVEAPSAAAAICLAALRARGIDVELAGDHPAAS